MKTSEVTPELVGKRCKCMFTGMMVSGTITDTHIDEHSANVKVEFDESHAWGKHTFTSEWSWARLVDEFGPLQYLELI